MQIHHTITNKENQVFKIIYNDVDDDMTFAGKKIESVRAYCFYQDKLVIVHESAGHWGIPGGGIDEGESAENGIIREVIEEANMKIVKMRSVGMHETIRPSGVSAFHARVVCLVEPIADFQEDPAGEVTEIKLIDPKEFIPLCDSQWGEMADRMLERALQFKEEMKLG